MKQYITAARVRSIIADAETEHDVITALRAHGIRYGYSTETGYLHIRIPCRRGYLRVFRDAQQLTMPGHIWTRSASRNGMLTSGVSENALAFSANSRKTRLSDERRTHYEIVDLCSWRR